ncbi:uncharacterized protein LAESUDRAFT_725233 [Laetiporus sulphureus 93-53]|uniref:Nitrogen regulatory protein areA GATA-like domain-containing protein n=1 Tax=Laetiporus sulphureus 93-53 TaxID=1314785 RepID=A0A165ELQ1_9APHY|nr:uncharacterized protein LAESUDRAFT_725233 [Laetiporus sulphureus 93-53]KZT07318.1 hypothetical protein LAESUDRAFT_725233 [Laetiporus sulphureus 93-53]
MPVPATITSYLPVLLASVTHNCAPDDNSYSPLPEGQVDYLSHEWREEDVWRSWRNMTRQKNAIANGMRLENASWRTWWKQRNKLKTISPETLNWLKDSDVTWLYGPLHVGSDWLPVSHSSNSLTPRQRQNSTGALPTGKPAISPVAGPRKPILKHRSIGQLLSLPSSPWFDEAEEDEEDDDEAHDGEHSPKRPQLLHTKSDTHISRRGRSYRKDSPPRIIAEESASKSREPSVALSTLSATASSETSQSTSSELSENSSGGESSAGSGSHTEGGGLKKKHISFNTFVEQCIAIEKPNLKRSNTGGRRGLPVFHYDDGYEEDTEVLYDDDDEQSSSPYYPSSSPAIASDSDDDDDDVIEMRSSRSRSSSMTSVPRPKLSSDMDASILSHPRFCPSMSRKSSTSEHVTIAPIAPTILKTTGVGNNLVSVNEGRVASSTKEVELVYAPPSHSGYSLPTSPSVAGEEVYHHHQSYFSVGTSPSPQARSPMDSPQIPTVGVLPLPSHLGPETSPSGDVHGPTLFPHMPQVDSPTHTDDLQDVTMEDTFDYFDGHTVEEYSEEWSSSDARRQRGRSGFREEQSAAPRVVRYAEGGAASVQTGRCSSAPASPQKRPVVVVNEANGAMEERNERSREGSPSLADRAGESPTSAPTYVHTSTPAVPVPWIATAHPQIVSSDAALLSPTAAGSCPRPTDSRSESRGRSLSRAASISDRERSGSRSSHGTHSPMGSLSPTGSALALGGGVHARGREREGRRGRMDGHETERGRERTGRLLGASLSPPSAVESPTRRQGEYRLYSPTLMDAPQMQVEPVLPTSSVSGSSTANVDMVRPSTSDARSAPIPTIQLPPFNVPSPIPEEDEQRSRQPTPANSPISALHAVLPAPVKPAPPSPSKEQADGRSSTSPVSPTGVQASVTSPIPIPRARDRVPRSSGDVQQDVSFVGRATDMMSSARGFLGSIWNAGTA